MNMIDALVAARKKLKSGKEYFADGRFWESGEDLRECLRITAQHRDMLHGQMANEARAFLASVNEKLGLVP